MSTAGRLLLIAVLVASLAVVAPAGAASRALKRCPSADLRYPFQKGGPKDFGVFRLKVANGTCATAHRVAKRWQRRFEGSPTATLPRKVYGFRFHSLPPRAAQTYRLRGTREDTVIRFAYVVPNG